MLDWPAICWNLTRRVRQPGRRSFGDGLWGIPVRDRSDDWLVIWEHDSEDSDLIVVRYPRSRSSRPSPPRQLAVGDVRDAASVAASLLAWGELER